MEEIEAEFWRIVETPDNVRLLSSFRLGPMCAQPKSHRDEIHLATSTWLAYSASLGIARHTKSGALHICWSIPMEREDGQGDQAS